MGARRYLIPRANLIPLPGNSLNRNLLNHSTKNLAYLTDLSFSLERVATHFPILAGLPPKETVHPPKCLKSRSSTVRTSTKSWMSKGLLSPNTRKRKLLTTSSRVMVSSPIEKKNVCQEGDQRGTRCLRPLPSLKPSKFLEISIDSSSSTQLAQLVILLRTKSKKIGTTSRDPCLI